MSVSGSIIQMRDQMVVVVVAADGGDVLLVCPGVRQLQKKKALREEKKTKHKKMYPVIISH